MESLAYQLQPAASSCRRGSAVAAGAVCTRRAVGEQGDPRRERCPHLAFALAPAAKDLGLATHGLAAVDGEVAEPHGRAEEVVPLLGGVDLAPEAVEPRRVGLELCVVLGARAALSGRRGARMRPPT